MVSLKLNDYSNQKYKDAYSSITRTYDPAYKFTKIKKAKTSISQLESASTFNLSRGIRAPQQKDFDTIIVRTIRQNTIFEEGQLLDKLEEEKQDDTMAHYLKNATIYQKLLVRNQLKKQQQIQPLDKPKNQDKTSQQTNTNL